MKPLNYIFLLIIFSSSISHAEDADYLSFNEFIEAIHKNEILSVRLGSYSDIEGEYVTGGKTKSFLTLQEGPDSNILLLNILRQNNVSIKKPIEDLAKYNNSMWFVSLMMLLLPLINIILAIFIFKAVKYRNNLTSKPT